MNNFLEHELTEDSLRDDGNFRLQRFAAAIFVLCIYSEEVLFIFKEGSTCENADISICATTINPGPLPIIPTFDNVACDW